MDKKNNVAAASEELLDESLKVILGNRYQDESHLFTPEAQQIRRNNRVIFTIKIAAFMLVLMWSAIWANSVGILTDDRCGFCLSVCSIVVGYNAGVCVSHLKGWRD